MTRSTDHAAARPIITTVYAVRHAESVANAGNFFASQSDSPLSERGRAQVERLTRAFTDIKIHAVYSSDLSRARETVAPIARARGLELRTLEGLRERAMGDLTGLAFDTVRDSMPEAWARLVARDHAFAPPGGESQFDLAARVKRTLAGIVPNHHGESIVIGSHGGTIHHIVRQLLGVHDHALEFWLAVGNASVTRIDLTEIASGTIVPRLSYANRMVAEPDGVLTA